MAQAGGSWQLLRCPFCGGSFTLNPHEPAGQRPDTPPAYGVIWCECCAFPLVAGIPVLKSDDTARAAMLALEGGRHEAALFALLGLDEARSARFRELLARGEAATYRDAIAILSPDPEGTYFIYRFSDPTFVMAEAILEALAQHPAALQGPILDLCGGSGHLTRTLSTLRPESQVVLADVFFWKLWLARTFTVPGAVAVCCDANQPLPFAPRTFRSVVLSDAFPYIWQKRLLAEEMVRQVEPDGLIVMPHLHSSLGWNYSAGMTLTPRSYWQLFAAMRPRLFADETLFAQAVERCGIDLSRDAAPEELGSQNSFTLIASADERLFRRFAPPDLASVAGHLVLNPLYRVERRGASTVLTLRYPTREYEDEFGTSRLYLPDHLVIEAELPDAIPQDFTGVDVEALRRRRVLLDAPLRYL